MFSVGNTWPGPMPSSRVQVNPDTALRSAAVWSCVRLLADVVSELPAHQDRGLTVTELAGRVGFSLSSRHRRLRALKQSGAISLFDGVKV